MCYTYRVLDGVRLIVLINVCQFFGFHGARDMFGHIVLLHYCCVMQRCVITMSLYACCAGCVRGCLDLYFQVPSSYHSLSCYSLSVSRCFSWNSAGVSSLVLDQSLSGTWIHWWKVSYEVLRRAKSDGQSDGQSLNVSVLVSVGHHRRTHKRTVRQTVHRTVRSVHVSVQVCGQDVCLLKSREYWGNNGVSKHSTVNFQQGRKTLYCNVGRC